MSTSPASVVHAANTSLLEKCDLDAIPHLFAPDYAAQGRTATWTEVTQKGSFMGFPPRDAASSGVT